MQFGYTILYVPDVRATLQFYERAFGFSTRFLHEAGDWGELETGPTKLAFCSVSMLAQMGKKTGVPDPERPCSEVALLTQDVSAAYQQALAQGAAPLQEPTQMPWGQTVAYVRDLNGFWVELCTPMGDAG
ncbi:VOC family protein [Acidovorax sp.]|uniref:VOC family protein n=1 Tax=Acidovorax sp. TaxID=1872122 RepID=UPI002634945D|nr:VOC family protein [Acidovorax sp.]